MARSNVRKLLPIPFAKTKTSSAWKPFIPKTLRNAEFVFIRDDSRGKSSLAPVYRGPFKVLARNFENDTFVVD